ncbi:hypothetical protein [Stagnihabitans tardus]|uniref:Uncharacterized protein n=1 Tax=Stagnihabitans tardus TaxID=2699202 RepID=A0AAE4Y9J2_9RHOB|nr:hypothetical protein [Stagnihabitans tardus]NBZ86234.1 hypothetical protein [Stagnihabitans tardus]
MTQVFPLIAGAALLALLLKGALDYLRAARALKSRRAEYFAGLQPRLTRLTPSGFARASLTHGGQSFDLQAIPDALSFRKLPCLWLMVTLTEPQPLAAETRIMARPSGLEPFSTHANLPFEVPLPEGFPDCTLRTSDPAQLPRDLIPSLAPLFQDPKVKELTLSPKGLRLVILAEEAPRNAYLIFREAELPQASLNPKAVQAVMDRLITLSESLNP